MKTVMRGLIGLVGLFNLGIGLLFLLQPAKVVAGFALSPLGSQGLATLRADFGGFFIGASVFALIGAWRASAAALNVPLLLLALALFGRFVSLALDGVGPEAVPPMVIEAVMLGLIIVARRSFAGGRA